MPETPKLKLTNKFGTGTTVDGRIYVNLPPVRGVAMSPEDAINLAAYLAVLAEHKSSIKLNEAIEAIASA